jgi:hypothetical protein
LKTVVVGGEERGIVVLAEKEDSTSITMGSSRN